jgi:hypothetical protein
MIKILSLVFLFFILTPGILWSYPKKTNKYSIALLHACVFAFVFYLIETFSNTPIREGLTEKDKITFNYATRELYTPENREKHKMFNNVYVSKNKNKSDRITTILNGKEYYAEIGQADFDDNFQRVMNKIKPFKK